MNAKSSRTDKTEDSDELSSRRVKTTLQQNWYDTIDPKEINKIIQKFFMALIWGFGATLTAEARPKYSVFLHD